MVKSNSGKIDIEDITILDWIRDLIPPRSEDEQKLLEENLKVNRQLTPVVITDLGEQENVLVDGHGRIEALKSLGKYDVKFIRCQYADEYAIKDAMLRIQLGRRNLSENAQSLLRAQIWQQNKKDSESFSKKETAESMNVNERTLTRDLKFAEAATQLEKIIPESQEFIKAKTTPKKVVTEIAAIAKDSPKQAKKFITEVSKGKTSREKSKILKQIKDQKDSLSFSHERTKSIFWKINTELSEKIKTAAKELDLNPDVFLENLIAEALENV